MRTNILLYSLVFLLAFAPSVPGATSATKAPAHHSIAAVAPAAAPAVLAHGPTFPPDPWDGVRLRVRKAPVVVMTAHGPTFPPDPCDGFSDPCPPDPVSKCTDCHRVQPDFTGSANPAGPLSLEVVTRGVRCVRPGSGPVRTVVASVKHGPTFPPDPWDPCLLPNPAPGCLTRR